MDDCNKHSGALSCKARMLGYESKRLNWTLSVFDIRLIGEYTTANGPYTDDYFFVFLTAFDDGWHEASFYAQGASEALQRLGEELGTTLEPGLCNSAHYKSRIMWPFRWRDRAFMEVVPSKKRGLLSLFQGADSFDIVPSFAMREIFGK